MQKLRLTTERNERIVATLHDENYEVATLKRIVTRLFPDLHNFEQRRSNFGVPQRRFTNAVNATAQVCALCSSRSDSFHGLAIDGSLVEVCGACLPKTSKMSPKKRASSRHPAGCVRSSTRILVLRLPYRK